MTHTDGDPLKDAGGPDDGDRIRALHRWRQAEQRVTRMWQTWLAAVPAERGMCYRLYRRALAAEEQAAAEFELVTRVLAARDAGTPMAESARH